MSAVVEVTGTSPTGDMQDALSQAVFLAMETLKTDDVEWTLVKMNGVTRGAGNRSHLTVTISAKVGG